MVKEKVPSKKEKEKENKGSKKFTSKSIELDIKSLTDDIYRVDIEFHGLNHSGPSYEGRIFINNPNADHDTPRTKKNGFVGSYHIFGHGGCFGGIGHCSINKNKTRMPYDFRPSHPLTPIYKRVEITEYFSNIKKNKFDFSVTVVPILAKGFDKCPVHMDIQDIVKMDKIMLKTYR